MQTEFTKTVDSVMPYCAGLRHTIGDILTDATITEKREAISKAITGRFAEDILRSLPDSTPPVPPSTVSAPPAPKPEVTKSAPASPVDRLTKAAGDALKADPKLTAEQAVTKALAADPAAYDELERARQASIGHPHCWED